MGRIFYDTEFIDDAIFMKGECHLKRMELDLSLDTFNILIDKYPDSSWINSARNKIKVVKRKKTNNPIVQESQE